MKTLRIIFLAIIILGTGCPEQAQTITGKVWVNGRQGILYRTERKSGGICNLRFGERLTEISRNGRFSRDIADVGVQVRTERGEVGWVSSSILIEPKNFTEEYQLSVRYGAVRSNSNHPCDNTLKPINGIWENAHSTVNVCFANGGNITYGSFHLIDSATRSGNLFQVKVNPAIDMERPPDREFLESLTIRITLVDQNTVKIGEEELKRLPPLASIPESLHARWRLARFNAEVLRETRELNFCETPIIVTEFELNREWKDKMTNEMYLLGHTSLTEPNFYIRSDDPRGGWKSFRLGGDGRLNGFVRHECD